MSKMMVTGLINLLSKGNVVSGCYVCVQCKQTQFKPIPTSQLPVNAIQNCQYEIRYINVVLCFVQLKCCITHACPVW